MRKLYVYILLLLPLLAVNAQDANFLLMRHHYTINSDGSVDYNVRKELKLLRNRSFSQYGETYVVYNPAFESVKINEAYTIRKDGTRVEVPQNGFISQLPPTCQNCGRLNGIRELVVVHTALEYDATIVLDYTIHRSTTVLDQELCVQQSDPVNVFDFIIDAPSSSLYEVSVSKPLQGCGAQVQPISDGHAYHIQARDVQPLDNDYYGGKDCRNVISISNPKAPVATEPVAALAECASVLAELKSDSQSEYASAIARYVQSNIVANHIRQSLLQYRYASPSEVWNSGCATDAEKSLLLVAMLKQAGFQARVIDIDKGMVSAVVGGDSLVLYAIQNPKHSASDSVSVSRELSWSDVRPLADGYYQLRIPVEKESYAIDATRLTSVRSIPVADARGSFEYAYTIRLPKGVQLVGGNIDRHDEQKGLGSVQIQVKQKGRTLSIYRKLTIEPDCISESQYADYRSLMQLWSQFNQVYLK